MFENSSQIPNSIGAPQIDTPTTSIESVIGFLDKHLPNFPAVFRRKSSSGVIKPEDDISQVLSIYLNREARSELFLIHFQYRYFGSSRSSDLAFIHVEDNNPLGADETFFAIEAKRLPTLGKDKKGSSREKEYVEGTQGAMERYKRGRHGQGLSDSAIFGYVQDNNSVYWCQEIIGWITDLIARNTDPEIEWNLDDKLSFEEDFTTLKKYHSRNRRTVGGMTDSINLKHYLIELN